MTNAKLDPSLLMDNAACASQCSELLDDHPTRQAVLLNVYRPLWDEIERLDADAAGVQAELASVKLENERLQGLVDGAYNRGFAVGSGNEGHYQREIARLRAGLTAARGLSRQPHGSHMSRSLEAIHEIVSNALAGAAAEPNPAQAPIARIRVANSRIVDAKMLAPGLPTGVHSVYCEPESVAPYTEPSEGQSVRIPTSEREAELMAKLGMQWLENHAPHRLKDSAETRDYLAARDAHDRVALELYRYKRCLYRANGRLMQIGQEPEKLDYSDSPELKS